MSRPVLLNNSLIAIFTGLFFWLLLWPYSLRHQLETTTGFPADTVVFTQLRQQFSRGGLAGDAALARTRLNNLIGGGTLAFEGPVMYQGISREPPYLTISAGMIELGLVQLASGSFDDATDSFLGQTSSAYAVNDLVGSGRVTGLASFVWRKGFMTDAVLLRGSGGALPTSASQVANLYLQSASDLESQQVNDDLEAAFGVPFERLSLFAYLASSEFGLEGRQVALQQRAALFLFGCMFLALLTQVSAAWQRERETFRIERMLGRSRNYFIGRWLQQSARTWIWGLSIAAISALLLRGFGDVEATLLIALWWAALASAGTLLAFLFVMQAASFPLARPSAVTQSDWRSSLGPLVISFGFVLGVILLSSSLFSVWRGAERELAELGADQLLASTTPAATTVLTSSNCGELVGPTSCAGYGFTNIYLWSPEMNIEEAIMEGQLAGIGRFRPEDAGALRIELIAGRWPQPGALEVTVNEAFLPEIRTSSPGFGVDQPLNWGYKVVGIVRTPLSQRNGLFASLYEAPVYLSSAAPHELFPDDFFLAPLGVSSLMMTIPHNEDITDIKQAVWAGNRDVEFIRPARFTLTFAQALRDSLRRLAVIFALTLFAVSLVYRHYIMLVFLQLKYELAIWRILGMSLPRIRLRLWSQVIGAPLIGGLAAALLDSAAIWRGGPSQAVQALLTGAALTALLALLSLLLTHNQLRSVARVDPSELYRHAR